MAKITRNTVTVLLYVANETELLHTLSDLLNSSPLPLTFPGVIRVGNKKHNELSQRTSQLLYMGFRATLNFREFKVVLTPCTCIFLILPMLHLILLIKIP